VPTVLIFSDPNCGPCTALLPEIGRWQRDHADRLTAAVISRGTLEEHRTKSVEHGLANVLLQRDREVAREYKASGTPAGVVVMPNGTIGSPLAQGAEAIRALVKRALEAPALLPTPIAVGPAMSASGNGEDRGSATAGGAKIGEPAPALRLPDLEGRTVDLADFRGSDTLVLFWNPGCGFCQRMLEDLKAWEANRPKGAPKLLVVSTGTVEANRAMGLRSRVLLDEGFTTARRFGATGTPIGVLVDAQGKIASHLAVGAESVLALTQIGQAATV
jgi:peroxiredoxin